MFTSIGDIVRSVEHDERDESVEPQVLGLGTEPLPLSPHVDVVDEQACGCIL